MRALCTALLKPSLHPWQQREGGRHLLGLDLAADAHWVQRPKLTSRFEGDGEADPR